MPVPKVFTEDKPNPFVEVTLDVYEQLKPVDRPGPERMFRVRRDDVVDAGLPFQEIDNIRESTIPSVIFVPPPDTIPVDPQEPVDTKPQTKIKE